MPRLLDLFCGAGGAAMGYHRAGFEVVGVDINPQPHYPFEFHQADALTYPLDGFDAIHASPPCQAYSVATGAGRGKHPDLYQPVRVRLTDSGTPWVIENVIGAPYGHGVVLCGSMFTPSLEGPDGRIAWYQRHRNFESSLLMFQPACEHAAMPGRPITIGGHPGASWDEYKHHRAAPGASWGAIMGAPWMNASEAGQAIPPAYTEWIGRQLLAAIARAA